MKYIIGVDVGTQSLRSGVLSQEGEFLFVASREYSPDFGEGNRAEQRTESWREALFETLEEVGVYLAWNPKIEPECIAVTSQRASVIPVDRDGEPLYPALMWQDKRATRECDEIAAKIAPEELYRQCGLRLDPYFSLPKMLWLKNNRPDIWQKACKLIGVQDYIALLLTGRYVTDRSQACRTMLLDINSLDWNAALLDMFGIDKNMLCELIEPGAAAGALCESTAKRTALHAGLPVLLCGGDQQCAALALGLFEPGDATANTGTGSFVLGYTDRPAFDEKQRVLCSAAAIPGERIVEAGIYASGATYNWCRRQFFGESGAEDVDFEKLNAEAASSPPGANGAVALPHFSGSAAPYWNPLAKGLFFNLGLGTTRGDLCRAVLEGIAGEISDNLALISRNARPVERLYVAGGLTRSPLYCQIMADSARVKVVRRSNVEAALLGCLMSACVTLGVYKSYREAFEAIAPKQSQTFEPDEGASLVYDHARELRRQLYAALDRDGVYTLAQRG
ncbi:MAG: FGGY family carbohydrate kinase [Oscillospiraceae bacterium]|nr:FGGY family carbohydrate kinase [Oscillospiraceae bacterium]